MGLNGRNILVTGGLGFFGSHLIKALIENGSSVYTTDLVENRRSYYFQQRLEKQTIYEQCDVADFRSIKSVIVKNKIDFVFHVAAQAIVDTAYYDPLGTITSNVIGTANVLEACRQYGKVKGILVTSTDKAYGKLPRVNEKMPLSGDHPYEASKASADLIAQTYFKTYELPVVITRFGNVYGEGDLNFNRIVPGIMASIIKSQTLKIRSDGKYVRDYVYVKDVVDATLLLARNIRKAKGEAFNISSLENLQVIEVVKRIGKVLELKVDYEILSVAKNEIPVQSVDFKKIKNTFGWKPKNNFSTTAVDIFNWYKDYFAR